MKESLSEIKDPICGMSVDETTTLQLERDGKTFYFCSEVCKKEFLAAAKNEKKKESGGCCGA